MKHYLKSKKQMLLSKSKNVGCNLNNNSCEVQASNDDDQDVFDDIEAKLHIKKLVSSHI